MARADLHVHSTASDGLFPPREVLRRAHGASLCAVALTDHDTIDGLDEASREARSLRIDFLPGCEISIDHEGQDIHLLAYAIDQNNPRLTSLLRAIRDGREDRVREMVRRLNQLGVRISLDQVAAHAVCSRSLGRMHVARALVASGVVRTVDEAFRQWIGPNGDAYLRKSTPPAAEVLAAIHAAGGATVLGHPALYGPQDGETAFGSWDLDGIEVFHPAHRPDDVERLKAWAARANLIATGGSDWHGDERPEGYIGCVQVGVEVVTQLRGRAAEVRRGA